MRKGTNAHPQDKSENQLPPPHLNILVPRDKLDIIMHRPSRQKNHCHPPPRIISRTALMFVSVTYCSHDYIHVISWLSEWLIDWFCIIIWQVNPAMVEQLQRNGMLFVGHDDEGKRMEIMELQGTYSSLICFFLCGFSVARIDQTGKYVSAQTGNCCSTFSKGWSVATPHVVSEELFHAFNCRLMLFCYYYSKPICEITSVYTPITTWPHLRCDVGLEEGEY